uniref:Uncharacterized protein n=1 Tax=Molossus molossus TaxID=27622 RepID=A0A7J8C8D8_MOLMO|nr:hypothetical protein HJG59_009862 [Molossus molossus]
MPRTGWCGNPQRLTPLPPPRPCDSSPGRNWMLGIYLTRCFLPVLCLCQTIYMQEETGREGGSVHTRKRERHRCERDTLMGRLPHAPRPGPGTGPAAQVRAFDWESNLQPFGARADAVNTNSGQGYLF